MYMTVYIHNICSVIDQNANEKRLRPAAVNVTCSSQIVYDNILPLALYHDTVLYFLRGFSINIRRQKNDLNISYDSKIDY